MMEQPPPLPPVNPYAAPMARVSDIVDDQQLMLADRGTRLGAAIVDGLVLLFVPYVLGFAALAQIKPDGGGGLSSAATVLGSLAVVSFIAIIGYNLVLLHRNGQTIAKKWLGIKVVRSDGSACALSRIVFARWLPITVLGVIPLLGPFVSLVDALLIFRSDYRCIHDHIADTVVVRA